MPASDAAARRTILLLAVSQALYSNATILVFASASLVGLMLAPSRALATLPITSFVIGSALTTIPAAHFMQHFGRKPGFMLGAAAGIAGAATAAAAIFLANFTLFCLATALQGIFQAFAGYYRFAAVEVSSPATKHLAISWVLTGGVVAAITGTLLTTATSDLLMPYTFAGSYLASAALSLVALAIIVALDLPRPSAELISGPRRAWGELLANPRLPVAIASAAISYAMMNLMMTGAPVAMVGCSLTPADASWAIQWHVLAMYVPSFFTGHLIKNYGVEKISAVGMALLLAAAAVGLSGVEFDKFAVALILLGLGWNFGFIGATTLLTETYLPAERAKVQGINDFTVAATTATASFLSGQILDRFGWHGINVTLIPFALIGLLLMVWLWRHPSSRAARAEPPPPLG